MTGLGIIRILFKPDCRGMYALFPGLSVQGAVGISFHFWLHRLQLGAAPGDVVFNPGFSPGDAGGAHPYLHYGVVAGLAVSTGQMAANLAAAPEEPSMPVTCPGSGTPCIVA
jgi:hypothetical protein